MYRKIFLILILFTVLSAGCENNSEEISLTETSAEISTKTETGTETSAETTVVTSVAAEETSETVLSIADPYYIEDGEPPRVFPAEEFYEAYPVKLIYLERQNVSDKVKTEILQEDIYNSDGLLMVKFYAEYPVIFGYAETVCERINNEIHDYIYGIFEKEKEWAEWYEVIDGSEDYIYKDYGRFSDVTIKMESTDYFNGGCDINGNIFSVHFSAEDNLCGVHWGESPAALLFDLRSGERIYFSDLIEDKDGISKALYGALWDFRFNYGGIPFGMLDADQYINIENMKNREFVSDGFGVDEDGHLLVVYGNADNRITVFDGCVCFYLWRADYGDFAIGIERVDISAKEIVPYLNEKGKSLFEGYSSAETTAPNVIEYKGKRWFDTTEWIPEVIDGKNLTDYDREFILMFENARNAEYYLS